MPLDAICLKGVVSELQQAVGLRIEKIQQPARDQVILTLRGNRKMLLCANPNQPRIHFTTVSRENPAVAPMFCMLLRKHLGGGYITVLEQNGLDRVVTITVRSMDEMGFSGEKKLVLECMGRRSNLILLDGDGRILDCLRHVDLEMSQQRQLLPGLFYHLPGDNEKADPLAFPPQQLVSVLRQGGEKGAHQALLDHFFGLSPLICREIVFSACGSAGADCALMSAEMETSIIDAFSRWQDTVNENIFTPFMVKRSGKSADFSYLPILQYGTDSEGEGFESFSELLDTFYESREKQERIRQKGQTLLKAATTARDRTARKVALQETELEETKNREWLRIQGELITANLYRMKKGESVLKTENYYEDTCPMVEISLDPLLTPQQNAARYFKLYTKAKTAEHYLTEQLAKNRAELAYLNSILDELSRAELEQDFNDVRTELSQAGYLKGQQKSGKKELKRGASKPREFRSTAGLRILVGRSNVQNDKLTKDAFKWDIWLHTQKIHGSHVILCTEGETPDEQSLQEAAILAAYFSQGRESNLVAVDYTAVKHVKKPTGARPGMVVYDPYQTAYVRPDEELVKALAVK